MKAALFLAAVGIALSITGYALMRADALSAKGHGLLGAALAFAGVAFIFIASVRAAL
jgi:hypothetical protein